MPVTADGGSLASYAQFPAEPDRDWLGRVCHLSGADLAVIRRRADPVTQLGYAAQLVTVRAIGTFQSDPAALPEPVVAAIARQLGIDDPGALAGYRDFAAQPGRFAFTVWLYRQAWADEVASPVLFRAAHRQLLARQILLPGHSVLTRLIATVRDRATHRVHGRLARAAPPELRARLEKLLVVPEGQRRSELDLLRRPPFTPTITGLVRALDRLDRIRALGAGELDLSGIPAARIVALARYADQAWATQLAGLGPGRRIATLVAYAHVLTGSARDDVIDIFDVVYGGLQRAATHRGEKRRAGELRDYDQAVAAVHASMRSLLDVLDDDPALTAVLEEFRAGRAGIEQNMGTVKALMRPPGDPFHERLVASYPQIRRFLPRLIEALELEAAGPGQAVLEACQALGDWLTGQPRTTRRPAAELPLEVVTPSWQRHVRDDTGTVDRAGYACCVLDQLRTRLRRRDVYAPGSTRWGDSRAELLTPQTWTEQRDTLCEDLALDPDPKTVIGQLTTTLDAAWRRTADGYAPQPRPAHRAPQRPRRDRAHATGCRPRTRLAHRTPQRGRKTAAGGRDR
jgi:hypothetical protein